MARRKTLTTTMVRKLKPRAKRFTLPDPELRGHYIRVTPTGSKTYVAVSRDPTGKQIWATIGSADVLTVDEAREKAREAIPRIKAGLSAFPPPPVAPDSFKAVAENYLTRHVRANGLRSESEITRILENQVYPLWKERPFEDIRRGDVTRVLDMVQDASGASAADHCLAVVRGVMNWHESRSDDYTSPIARNMRRTDAKARKRARILDDAELRTVWTAAEGNGTFGALLRLALLTAQRREKIASMRWEDVSVDGVWQIATEEREKGTGGALVLPETALEIIRAQKRIGLNPYVLAGRGDGHFKGFSPCKRAFNKKVGDLPRWTLHDLRRTSRSLMSRAGVRPDIAERVMGHAKGAIEGVYDRHEYLDEKAAALRQLAGQIEMILHPPADNVTAIHAEA